MNFLAPSHMAKAKKKILYSADREANNECKIISLNGKSEGGKINSLLNFFF